MGAINAFFIDPKYGLSISKTPAAVKPYTLDWSDFLGVSDTIKTSAWSCEAGITIANSSNTDTTATAVISGGTEGQVYQLTNTMTSNSGVIETKTITVQIQTRRSA